MLLFLNFIVFKIRAKKYIIPMHPFSCAIPFPKMHLLFLRLSFLRSILSIINILLLPELHQILIYLPLHQSSRLTGGIRQSCFQ